VRCAVIFRCGYQLEPTRRTLEAMVKDGLLEKSTSYERRQDTTQSGSGAGICVTSRVTTCPVPVQLLRGDDGGKREAINGEMVKID